MINPTNIYITLALMVIFAAVSSYAIRRKEIFQLLIFHPTSVINRREYYRIISAGFVHIDFVHLTLNLFMFYVFCSGLEESKPGPDRLLLFGIIITSLVSGHMFTLAFHRKDVNYSCAGASGIVIGCLCSYMIYHPFENHLNIPLLGNIPNIYSAGIYLCVMLFYNRKFSGGKIDYGVHVGGGIGGSVATLILDPVVITNIF